MYHSYWGLCETPFRARLDPRFFYESSTHEEALARLHFLVEYQRRLGLLMGPHGTGKSLVMECFARKIHETDQAAVRISLLGLTPDEFPRLLAERLGLNVDRDRSVRSLWHAISDRLAEFRYQQLATVVLFDDAGEACPGVLALVSRLVQLDTSPDARVTIVLAGEEAKIATLGDSLLERAELRIDLAPWDAKDTAQFIERSLARAGRDALLFTNSAVDRLYELTQGIPRRICHLADLALMVGAGRHLNRIDVETIDSVYRELGVIEV